MSSPRDVIRAALCVNLPDVERQAELIERALVEHGHLAAPNHPPTEADIQQAAELLAEQSGHPRYTATPDGKDKLLQSAVDVDLAHRCAAKTGHQSDQQRLADARALLLSWHASRRASEGVSL